MKRTIGLEVHATSTTFAVLSESGKRLGTYGVETNGQALVERFKTIPGDKYVALEEGTQSAWLDEILSPHAKDVVVAAIAESRGQKDDERDAYKLAEDLRTGRSSGACSRTGASTRRYASSAGRMRWWFRTWCGSRTESRAFSAHTESR
jgi:hypothetical protein